MTKKRTSRLNWFIHRVVKPVFKKWKRLYNYSRRFYMFISALDAGMRTRLFVMQAISIINNLLYLAGTLAIIPLINYLTSPEKTLQNKYIGLLHQFITQETSFNFIIVLSVLSILALFVARAFYISGHYIVGRVHRQLFLYYSNRLFTYYMRQKEYDAPPDSSANITINLTARLAEIIGSFINPVFRIADILIFMTTGIFIISLSSPPLFILLLCPVFLILLAAALLVRKRLMRSGKIHDESIQKRQGQIVEGLNIREYIQIIGKESVFIREYIETNAAMSLAYFRMSFIATLFGPINEFLIYTMTVLCVILLASLTGELDLSVFTVFLLVLYRIMPRVNELFTVYTQMHKGVVTYDAMVDALLPALSGEVSIKPHIKKPYPVRNGIALQHISYKYPSAKSQKAKTLDDINMEIKAGEKIGICGESGSGKTTLLRILTGSITPHEGKILVDRLSLDTPQRQRRWHDCLGYVSQNVALLQKSIADNIALEESGAKIKQQQLQQALYLAAADEFVAELKEGARTSLEEAGKSLSGGQRQRLMIARAIYQKPRVLILDEATSALDKKTEAMILERLWENLQNETIIFVTHRIESIQNCDKLFVLQKGKITAQGTYKQLIRNQHFKQLLGRLKKKEAKAG